MHFIAFQQSLQGWQQKVAETKKVLEGRPILIYNGKVSVNTICTKHHNNWK
jgi:predicted transcriptional regulator